jgi:hypothetical protein
MIYLGIGLLGLIIINIILGSVKSVFESKFDKVKLLQGVVKGFIVSLCFIGCYFIGLLNPNIIVINANGQDINLLTGVHMVVLGGYLVYGKEVLTKLATFTGAKFETIEKK